MNTATADKFTLDEDLSPEDVVLHGETAGSDDGDDDCIPVRTLSGFSVFNAHSLEFVSPLTVLMNVPGTWTAVGIAHPYTEEEDNHPTSAGQLVQLSELLSCSVHWVTRSKGSYTIDQHIYLRTAFAWYLLRTPSPAYKPYIATFASCHQIMQSLLELALRTPAWPLHDILKTLGLSPSDVESTSFVSCIHYKVILMLTHLIQQEYFTAAMDGLSTYQEEFYRRVVQAQCLKSLPSPPTSLDPTHYCFLPVAQAAEQFVLKRHCSTVVTPKVAAIAQSLFSQVLEVVTFASAEEKRTGPSGVHQEHNSNPHFIKWGQASSINHVYQSVGIDGVIYSAGDIIMVEPGEDTYKPRAKNAETSQASCPQNNFANTRWFCKICYFFEEEGSKSWKKMFHAQWLQHGAQTLLQESAHPRALFWLTECDDLPLQCILSHCNIVDWPVGTAEPPEDVFVSENMFFTGLIWDANFHAFIQLPKSRREQALAHCPAAKPCVACGLLTIREEAEDWNPLDTGGFSHDGVDYHVHDFIYYHDSHQQGLLQVAHIMQFIPTSSGRLSEVEVCCLGRYDTVLHDTPTSSPLDNRRLFKTEATLLLKASSIEGKAYVSNPSSLREREEWCQEDHHFYCDLESSCIHPESPADLSPLLPHQLPQCHPCLQSVHSTLLETKQLLASARKLRGLELFSGAGGLSTGLHQSGFVDTKWAVEFSPSAAKSFQINHKDAAVYCICSNCLLHHTLDIHNGGSPPPLQCQTGEMPAMPKRGEVDFIYGGPPCQSFSRMNHHRKVDDQRSVLICNMISYVEFYRPLYFLLENVVGLLTYTLTGPNQDGEAIKMGVVKFIMRSLTALGYQVQFQVLQAGQYGAPQGRRRVVFFGARSDVPFPQFPAPQYAFPKLTGLGVTMPTGERLYPPFFSGFMDNGHQCAPFPSISINEAIGDLPKFDWQNPCNILPRQKKHMQDIAARTLQGIPSLNAVTQEKGDPGFRDPVPYISQPMNRYQHHLRDPQEDSVSYHYTKKYSAVVVERTVNVPLVPNAGFIDIYGRLDGQGHFGTALTTVNPSSKGGKVLHPEQKRALTVRECARAQGFPDSYMFCSTSTKDSKITEDQLRQIGNAVPVPLAHALGVEIGRAYTMYLKSIQAIHL
ncbi:S-adenosyl-L-methionine-dependent methyltransferase [Epithele typhae]|uniref:S-adenosyl-L-methionine-dependent methyltransferase n=1 Tax=Epithele typhae TaxID=378194 RepID=UPI00200816E0|nr:S-adenosyl-L-methionine-dependent methyltransferase [Epithele typhae]KAH9945791.1 S-adenosyl-L-methionine-dependent methyltransferase [Epithele typhae]